MPGGHRGTLAVRRSKPLAQALNRRGRGRRALPVRGRVVLTAGAARADLVRRLGHEAALPAALAQAVADGPRRVREHVHGRWRHIVIPAYTPTAGGRTSRREGESLHVLVAPGVLALLAPVAAGPAARLGRSVGDSLGLAWRLAGGDLTLDGAPVGLALTCLLGLAVDSAFDAVESVAGTARRIEARALARERARSADAKALLAQRRRAEELRAALGILRDGIGSLGREPPGGAGVRFGRRLEDVDNHLGQAIDALDAARDGLSAAINYHLAASQNRVNEVIKTLTVLATVITPITVISSIYGMNFAMPETEWRYGYAFALALMAGCAGALVIYFRRRGWL